MWFEIFVIFWAIHTNPNRCSLVIDRGDVEGIDLKDYCPKMPFCAEGAHTMCMYYNPNRVAGPRCSYFQNISVNNVIADQLLDIVNEMRGQVAMGRETGRGNVTLPRAYGMFKLKWDNELATFAQVLANTCTLMHDICRATQRFPEPGQMASMVRFTIPDWLPVMHKDKYTGRGFSADTIQYATKEASKFWYYQKKYVTVEMIKNVPDWLAQPSNTAGKMFLQLVDGKATHMGCGVSAYVEYGFHGHNPSEIIFNAIHIICNFSSQPKKGTSVYRTKELTAEELCPKGSPRCVARYKSKCGCPPNTAENDRCLCTDPIPYTDERTCGKDKNCKPAVVLLPIFTVEDAPQQDISRQGMSKGIDVDPLYDEGYNEWQENEIVHDRRKNNHNIHSRRPNSREYASCSNDESTSYIMNSIEPPYNKERITGKRIHRSNEKQNYFRDDQQIRRELAERAMFSRRAPLPKKNKQSIFSRAPKFGLHNTHSHSQPKSIVKKDVAPRKDFSNAKEVLDKYLQEKRQKDMMARGEDQNEEHGIPEDIDNTPRETTKPTITIRPRFKTAGIKSKYHDNSIKPNHHENPIKPKYHDNLIKPNYHDNPIRPKHNKAEYHDNLPINHNINKTFLKNKFSYLGFGINDDAIKNVDNNYDIEEADRKLMTLLDNLEQEVKHVELDGTEKEIFDAKLKKIYGSIANKPDATVKNKREFKVQRHPSFQNNQMSKYDLDFDDGLFSDTTDDPKMDEFDKQMYDTEDMITDFQSKDIQEKSSHSLYARPLPRHQNTIRPITEKKMDYVFRNTEDIIFKNKNKIGNKDHKYSNHYGVSKLNHREPNERFKEEEVRTLPYNIQYKKKNKREQMKNLNKFTDFEDKHRMLRPDDEKGRNLNRIDEQRVKYEEEPMSDYGDIKQSIYGINSDKPYNEEDYEKDYMEELLSAERRKYYQDKLDSMKRKKYSTNSDKPVDNRDTGRSRRPSRGHFILGPRKGRPNSPHRYYLPNRASHHNI